MAGRVDGWVPFLGVQPTSEHQSVTMGAGWPLPEGSTCQWEKDRKQIHHPQGPAWRECGMAPGGCPLSPVQREGLRETPKEARGWEGRTPTGRGWGGAPAPL